MDAADPAATDIAAYVMATPNWRTDLYAAAGGTLLTHAESIALLRDLGVKFMPELKAPVVDMPFNGFTQEMYAQALIDDYKTAGIPPSDVWVQSFNLADLRYWLEAEPAFGAQAVLLDGRYTRDGFDPMRPETWQPSMAEVAGLGVRYIGPPIWMLLTLDGDQIVATPYAKEAKAAGLEIIPWTLERSGPLAQSHGAWFLQSVAAEIDDDGDIYRVLDVLAQEIGVAGVFSDWPATVTYYANCMGL
jgi:glycerophosphoryl diester phosphodiesterase